MQVAGAMLGAMGAGRGPWAVYTQPSSVRPLPNFPNALFFFFFASFPPVDRLARAGVRVSRSRRGARGVSGRAGVDGASARERTAQGKARCRVRYRGARRMGQLVSVASPHLPIHLLSRPFFR